MVVIIYFYEKEQLDKYLFLYKYITEIIIITIFNKNSTHWIIINNNILSFEYYITNNIHLIGWAFSLTIIINSNKK